MPEGTLRPRLAAGGLLTLPNAITFGRLCAVPLAVWLILQQERHIAFGLFAAAGLSDALDGWLARRSGTAHWARCLTRWPTRPFWSPCT